VYRVRVCIECASMGCVRLWGVCVYGVCASMGCVRVYRVQQDSVSMEFCIH
jgi:hypothetical protein